MADTQYNFRESTKLSHFATEEGVDKQEAVLGETALNQVDDAADHVPNVVSGLKAALSNPKTSEEGKERAKAKLDVLVHE